MSIAATPARGRLNEVVVYFLRLGLIGFGGPVALVGPTRSGHRFPLTVGRLENNLVLLDGYHRAASFWRSAPENASISAYVPTFLATSQ